MLKSGHRSADPPVIRRDSSIVDAPRTIAKQPSDAITLKRLALTIILATILIASWLTPAHKPQAGQACGPAHHWTETPANVLNTELNCSPD